MRQMNRMLSNMNNMLTDPFGTSMFGPGLDMGMGGMGMQMMNPMMSRQSFPGMNLNRLLSNGAGGGNGMSYSSSSVFSVTSSGMDGRPQVYQETRAIRNGPDGVRESIQTVQDSVSGRKKMSIGHHIGERGHVVEKEQNLHTGEREEREDFINLDEEETEEFERDFSNKTRQLAGGSRRHCQIEEISSQPLPAIQSYVYFLHHYFISNLFSSSLPFFFFLLRFPKQRKQTYKKCIKY
jgi:myeloid leukemia factor 1